MIYDLPPIQLDPIVTVETVCETPLCVDVITTYYLCGETVYVGPGVPNYFVLPGTSCSVLPGTSCSVLPGKMGRAGSE